MKSRLSCRAAGNPDFTGPRSHDVTMPSSRTRKTALLLRCASPAASFRIPRRGYRILAALGVALAFSHSALAEPTYDYAVYCEAAVGSPNICVGVSGSTTNPTITASDSTFAAGAGDASAGGTVVGTAGSIGAGTTANAAASGDSNGYSTAGAQATAFIQFTESILITSSELAPGTNVNLLLSGDLDGLMETLFYGEWYASAGSLALVQYTFGGVNVVNFSAEIGTNTSQTVDLTESAIFPAIVGETYSLGISMSLWAAAQAWGSQDYPASATALTNFQHTFTAFINPLAAGVDVVSESGHNYARANSVPEPASAALVGIGLLGLMAVRRRGFRTRVDANRDVGTRSC